MDYFDSRKKLEKSLKDRLADADVVDNFLSEINSVGDNYNLTLSELGTVYEIIDKILKGQLKQDELLKNLLDNLGVTEEEISEITILILELVNKLKEVEPTAKKLSEVEKELDKRGNNT